MSTVYLDGPSNSQMFTTCCDVAITDREDKCPRCRQLVEPSGHGARWSRAYGYIKRGGHYGNHRGIQDRPPTSKAKP
jgi:hypothetical protein